MGSEEQRVFEMREDEMERLDDLHVLCRMMANGRLYWAPLRDPKSVLDLGCGTGKWIKDFAHENPETRITGLDLQPSVSGKNIETLVADLEKPWPIKPGYDYIHTRWLIGCLFNWKAFFKQCFDNLNPGGWFEILDIGFPCESSDGSLRDDSHLSKWNSLLIHAAEVSGRSLTKAKDFARLLEEVGFSDVTTEIKALPTNSWPESLNERAMGEIALPIHKEGHQRLGHDFLCPNLQMDPQKVDAKLGPVWKEMEDTTIHSWWPIYIVYGRKSDNPTLS